jgi:PKD repeat protein
MIRFLTFLLPLCFFSIGLVAQPTNDDCAGSIVIEDVTNYCSVAGAFTNVGATASLISAPSCFGSVQRDVWFSFVAEYTDVTVIVRGMSGGGGTLPDPQVSLYVGVCDMNIEQLSCKGAVGNNNIVEVYQGGLFPGTTYFIRVQATMGQAGTFQLCLNNYNPPVDPTSDCFNASILCDKSGFSVQKVTGAGSNNTELNDASCFFNGQGTNFETNSTWFLWTCDQPGTLEFTLSPLNPTDDLDFVVYRLPAGLGTCSGKQVVRCMASGESFGINSIACLGPTGLRAGDADISEDAGCSNAGDDAWLSPLDMLSGETYALCVNNFSSTGNGFSVLFGGTGTFVGPRAAFNTIPSAVCLGTPVQVFDASVSPFGAITDWKWSFGYTASPQTAITQGPHTVQFNAPGLYPVALTITSETAQGRECKVTDIQTVLVYPDVEIDTIIAEPDCNGGTNGAVRVSNIVAGTPPYLFSWNGAPFSTMDTLTGLSEGLVGLVIRDANNCETDLEIAVLEKRLTVDADIVVPLCFGDSNGQIELEVTNGTPPYLFNWGGGFVPRNDSTGLTSGTYKILGLDASLCKGTFEVEVGENAVVRVGAVDINDISCFGAGDGTLEAFPSGGVGGFQWLWSDGQTGQQAVGLAPGTYSVTVSDANGCSAVGMGSIVQPNDLDILLDGVRNLRCFGIPEGQIFVRGKGGIEPFLFGFEGLALQPSDTLRNLPAGEYWVRIVDINGCTDSVLAVLSQPQPLVVSADPRDTLVDLGGAITLSTRVEPSGRVVDYAWSPALGLSCDACSDPIAEPVSDVTYLVKVTDSDGCISVDTVIIRINKFRPVFFPNVFAPGGIYPNDGFTGYGNLGAELITFLRIYDRWGSLVFETGGIGLNDPNLGWDGRIGGKLVQGVFAYVAGVKFVDGVELVYEGSVTVYR